MKWRILFHSSVDTPFFGACLNTYETVLHKVLHTLTQDTIFACNSGYTQPKTKETLLKYVSLFQTFTHILVNELYTCVGRLNGVVSLWQCLRNSPMSQVLFSLMTKWTRESAPFMNRNLSWEAINHVCSLASIWNLYIPDLRRVSCFHLIAVWTLLFVPWTCVTLVYPREGTEFPPSIVYN